jgi:hypothetical protein
VGNSIEYDCLRKYGECKHWEAMHGGFDYHDERFKNCSHCTRLLAIHYREFVEKRGEDKVRGVE